MKNLSNVLDEVRTYLLAQLGGELAPWSVLHLTLPGPTEEKNFKGVGPWARIWALPKSTLVKYPDCGGSASKAVSYVIAVYIPRVFTTDDLLATIIHEYLHIGLVEGTMCSHPPKEEGLFIDRSEHLASLIRARRPLPESIEFIGREWADLKSDKLFGWSLSDSHDSNFGKAWNSIIKPELICLNSYE